MLAPTIAITATLTILALAFAREIRRAPTLEEPRMHEWIYDFDSTGQLLERPLYVWLFRRGTKVLRVTACDEKEAMELARTKMEFTSIARGDYCPPPKKQLFDVNVDCGGK